MRFSFSKPACQNIRRSLRKEWLQTNGLGDYSSGTVPGCNTRKYHGLLVANLSSPPGRHVLLSTLEESVIGDNKEFFFSSRKHPGTYFPRGYEYMEHMEQGEKTLFRYRIGPLVIHKEQVLVHARTLFLTKYTFEFPEGGDGLPPLFLRVKPQLAFRHMHELTRANMAFQVSTFPAGKEGAGFFIRPYNDLPPLYMQTAGLEGSFHPAPDWCMNVEYFMEEERGFPFQEDLFNAGMFEMAISPISSGKPLYLSASIDEVTEPLEKIWREEATRRSAEGISAAGLLEHLRQDGKTFLTHISDDFPAPAAGGKKGKGTTSGHKVEEQPSIVAGYHWFNAWGRDTLIALPGLTFAAGRMKEGLAVLAAISKDASHGLVPNLLPFGDSPPAYNTVDASLWYIWAVQQLQEWMPGDRTFIREYCWPVIKSIVTSYKNGGPYDKSDGFPWPPIRMDEEGMVHAGNEQTQLTWMDANSSHGPVTPRHGCPVEINALWFNALVYTHLLAEEFREPEFLQLEFLHKLRDSFRKRFWTPEHGGCLGDVWRDGRLDTSIRPNQIFAVSLPYPVIDDEEQACVVECVRNNLLTPFGLRTLSPQDPAYKGFYGGGPDQRDEAYHQGTVWPWLLGHYTQAMLKAAWDTNGAVADLLNTISPLFTQHMGEAGLGSLSEIFSGNPPYLPNGTIAQAWSVAEVYRGLRLMQKAAPGVFAAWEARMEREAVCVF